MSVKNLVVYDAAISKHIRKGARAIVGVVGDKTKVAMTSRIIKVDGEGCFETTNSLYIPRKAA